MPSLSDLKDRIEQLRLDFGDWVGPEWYDGLCDLLHDITQRGAVDYEGYVHKNLIPDADMVLNLGSESQKFKQVHAGYGYFSENVFVQGKRVLKDEDPIYLAGLFDEAKADVTEAINDSYVYQKLADIEESVLNILASIKPNLIAKTINYDAPALADIFSPDVEITKDGRIKIKMVASYDVYTYLKLVPKDEAEAVIALLNMGDLMKKDTWYEFETTVISGDKVNVRVFPGSRVTIFIYNVGSV